MKLVFPEIDHVFDTRSEFVPTLVIENPELLYRLLVDLREQISGGNGKCVVSEDGCPLSIAKQVELLTEFVPFTLSKKSLISKASASLEQNVLEGDLYEEAMELAQRAEAFLIKATFACENHLHFSPLTLSSLIKAAGPEFCEEYDSLPEKILDYMELVTEYDQPKLFVLYNLRSLVSDEQTDLLLDSILRHEYNVLMIESSEHARLSHEQRYIVDASLCEIS